MKQMSGWQNTAPHYPEPADTGFLFDPMTGHTFVLNQSGRVLYDHIRANSSREQMVEHMIALYGLDPTTAEQDVDDFVGSLRRLGFSA